MGFIKFGKMGTEYEVESFVFPGGEIQVRLPENARDVSFVVNVCACLTSAEDVLRLVLACNALDAAGYRRINLVMPYVPYARQDRRCNDNEAHALKAFAKIINDLKFFGVIVYDPHSDVVEALIENISIVTQEDIVVDAVRPSESYSVVSPDGGALKKIYKVAKAINAKRIIKADKVRDLATGKIVYTEIGHFINSISDTTKLLVVDDICDGGRTFVELGKAFRKEMVSQSRLELYITHGIFSKGFDELLQYYSKIYTTNSFRQDINQENVEVFDIWGLEKQ